MGFCRPGDAVCLTAADDGGEEEAHPEDRLSWHLNGTDGYRAGAAKQLGADAELRGEEWSKVILGWKSRTTMTSDMIESMGVEDGDNDFEDMHQKVKDWLGEYK